ncbi:MAG: ornithine carbamoyltransferase [Polyangiaceae bacterium]|nr:ornithine carbamoyltransferase [Polyangiaceae bacterium]
MRPEAMPRHLRSLMDLSPRELKRVLELARTVKRNPAAYHGRLAGRSFALVFSKQSTRTRVSFEVGIAQLGGHSLFLPAGGQTGAQMGRGETPADTARVLSRYVQGIIVRWHEHSTIEELAAASSVPVVNALSDRYHPCQALADAQALEERFGSLRGLKLVFVGPANNVSNSLMLAGPRCGFDVTVACPADLVPEPEVLRRAMSDAAENGTRVALSHDPAEAVVGANAIYTDTWVSMGQEAEAEALRKKLAGFRVDAALMSRAAPNAVFMHCLPAHRGEEVTDEVLDGPHSIVLEEAENRLHAQKALLLLLCGVEPWQTPGSA